MIYVLCIKNTLFCRFCHLDSFKIHFIERILRNGFDQFHFFMFSSNGICWINSRIPWNGLCWGDFEEFIWVESVQWILLRGYCQEDYVKMSLLRGLCWVESVECNLSSTLSWNDFVNVILCYWFCWIDFLYSIHKMDTNKSFAWILLKWFCNISSD